MSSELRVAAVFTECRHRSHAHVILENFLEPYLFRGKWMDPGMKLVSFYGDQSPDQDLSAGIAARYHIPTYSTISDALCVGGNTLAVDAILSIGEHGNYPVNSKGQRQYPRKRFFDEIVTVFRRSGRSVPVFNDKHLSYRWDWSKAMYETSREVGFALMAGSSVPLAQRIPALEMDSGAPINEAMAIHGGPFESYDFHAIEVLQSLVEFREGGETGVSEVRMVQGPELWKALDRGEWSLELADACMQAELGATTPGLRQLLQEPPFSERPPSAILITYRSGLRASVLTVGRSDHRWTGAIRQGNRIKATRHYVGPWRNRCLFMALSHAIQHHFRTGRPPYPVERTLLASGILEAAVDSRHQGGIPIETPDLKVSYRGRDYSQFRETGESWQLLTETVPEPQGFRDLKALLGSTPPG